MPLSVFTWWPRSLAHWSYMMMLSRSFMAPQVRKHLWPLKQLVYKYTQLKSLSENIWLLLRIVGYEKVTLSWHMCSYINIFFSKLSAYVNLTLHFPAAVTIATAEIFQCHYRIFWHLNLLSNCSNSTIIIGPILWSKDSHCKVFCDVLWRGLHFTKY